MEDNYTPEADRPDQYLNFKLLHPLTHKRSVVRSLNNRAQQYVTTPEDRKSELAPDDKHMSVNGYSVWALAVPPSKANRPSCANDNQRRPMFRLHTIAGLLTRRGRLYRSLIVYMCHKPANILRSMVVHLKDKTPNDHQCGTIYHITCDNDSSHTCFG